MIKLMAKIRFDTPEGEKEEVLYHNIVSVDIEALDRGNVTDVINWGIYSNRGSLSFIDRDGIINGMIENLPVVDVKIYISNESNEILLATMKMADFSHNDDTNMLEIELSDKIEELQNKAFNRLYPFEETSALAITRRVFTEQAGMTTDDWYGAREVSAGELMSSVKIYCPDLKADNVWEAISQICEASMIRVFADKNGKLFISCGDSVSGDASKPIIIRSRNILSKPQNTPKRKTKISAASLSLKAREKQIDGLIAKRISYNIYNYNFTPENGVIWRFVGNDKSINPSINHILSLVNNQNSSKRDALIGFQADIDANTHSVNPDAFLTAVSVHLLDDPSVREQDQEREMEDISYRVVNGTNPHILLDFTLPTIYWESMNIVSSAYTEIKGNFYTDNEDVSSGYGAENQQLRLPSNSLMQTANTINGNPYGDWYIAEVQKKCQDGVECYELECGFSDYYYEDGTIAKRVTDMNSAPQVFNKYEVVQPYVTRGGVEVPLATYQDGSPMSFVIIGIKYHYAGIAKQTLYLQEYREV